MRKSWESKGFTLIEIMVVVAIAALMISIIAPRISRSFEGAALKTSVKRMTAALRAARSYSAAEGVIVSVDLELGGQGCVFSAIYPSGEKVRSGVSSEDEDTEFDVSETASRKSYIPEFMQEPFALDRSAFFERFFFVDGATYDSGNAVIRFFPRGFSTGGTIVITSESGTTYAVSVDRVTGRVTMQAESS